MNVTIYHNPACGTSRNVLGMIRDAGIEPRIVEYLKTPPTRDDAVARNPILIERPIVAAPRGVRLCRPSEAVLELLDAPQAGDLTTEKITNQSGAPIVVASELSAAALPELRAALAEAGLPPIDPMSPAVFHRFAITGGQTVGYGGIEGSGKDRLLRSLVILPAFRGKGFGAAAADRLERIAGNAGATRLHLLTMTAAPFFEKLGYVTRDRMSAPGAIAVTSEFATLCPATARYMVKPVQGRR
jgi:arsenate reductase